MADNDGDSRMASSPELTDTEDVETPLDQITSSSILSPPDSQHRSSSGTAAANSSMPTLTGSNANGKRPLTNISNGDDTSTIIDVTSDAAAASGAKQAQFPPRTHQGSGYTWTRSEDEPGFAWLNKKAVDERNRAWEGMVSKDAMVRSE
jgi:hypothetical protein